MLAHSFYKFYVVTKFILPSIRDLNFSELNYDNTCTYLDNRNICDADTKKYLLDYLHSAERLNHMCPIIRDKLGYIITQHTTF